MNIDHRIAHVRLRTSVGLRDLSEIMLSMAVAKDRWVAELLKEWVSEEEPSVVYQQQRFQKDGAHMTLVESILGLTAEGHDKIYVHGKKEFKIRIIKETT